MAGRGRGGGGRGRGRGASMSFSVDQLGVSPETLPVPVTQPPPLYPPMLNKPILPTTTPEMEYMLTMKKIFADYFRDSPAFVHDVVVKNGLLRTFESDLYQSLNKLEQLEFDWKTYPLELRPNSGIKRKQNKTSEKARKKAKNIVDIQTRLSELEKREGEETEDETEEKADDEEEDEKDEDVEDEDHEDEEMDEGNDYSNNYFDNGENYVDEEEDNLDDEPIY